jgi:F0F1-type ATP synthase assembly protein I
VDRGDRREMYNGFGEAYSRAMELVLCPLMFALGGYFLDGWLGTRPLFTVLLGLFGLAGVVARMVLQYALRMKAFDAELPSRRAAAGRAEGAGRPAEGTAA